MYDSLLAASRAVKVCSKCQKTKPLTAFHRNSSSIDGRQPRCIVCSSQYKKEYSKIDKIIVAYKVCTHCGERKKASEFGANQHTKDNLDHRCFECKRKYDREYLKTERGKIANRKADHVRRSVEAKAGNYKQVELKLRWRLVNQQLFNSQCPYCGIPIHKENRTLDHLIPLSKGGTNQITNLIYCCKPCNIQKNDKPLIKFLKSRGILLEPFIEITKDTWESYIYERLNEQTSS